MKTGIVVSSVMGHIIPQRLVETPKMYTELDEALTPISELGYDGIELFVENPEEVKSKEVNEIVISHGLEIVALGTGPICVRRGLSFSDRDASVRSLALDAARGCMEIAAEWGSLLTIGSIRGKGTLESDQRRAMMWLEKALVECDEEAGDRGVSLILEPINRYETKLVNTVDEALEMINRTGLKNTGVLVDTFHMNIEEASIADAVKRASGLLLHVHVADSNRWPPGYGHFDFGELVSLLREIGYDGYLSSEALGKPDPQTAVRSTINYLKKLLAAD